MSAAPKQRCGAARSWLYETVEEAMEATCWRAARFDQAAADAIARVNAMTAGVQAVDLIYSAAGSASVYSNGLIDRCFRDVHVAAQHVALHPSNYEVCGAVMLGLPSARPPLAPLETRRTTFLSSSSRGVTSALQRRT